MQPAKAQLFPFKGIAWEQHISALGRTNRALARYAAMLTRLPSPELLLSPLTVQEAVLSSRIEGTFATMTEVLQFNAGAEPEQEAKRLDIEEINRYRNALSLAELKLKRRPFSLNLLLDMHRTLLTSTRGSNKMPGTFRREQNYIGSRVGGVETIRFMPPAWETLPEALRNWEHYYHEDAPDPILQLGLIHAQFEFLHPFLDGNGRIGRILIPLFLYERGLLPRPMFYLSEYIEEHRDEYIDHLQALGTTAGWNAWCTFFLTAVEAQADANATKADKIFNLYEELKSRFITATRSQYAVPLLDAIFQQPIFRASQLDMGEETPSRVTLTNLLNELTREGALEVAHPASGRSGQMYRLKKLLEIAEA